MKQLYRTQTGFSVFEGLLVLVVLGALVFVGYTFMSKQKATTQDSAINGKMSQLADKVNPKATTNKEQAELLDAVKVDDGTADEVAAAKVAAAAENGGDNE